MLEIVIQMEFVRVIFFFFFLNKKSFSNQNYKKKVQIIAPAVQDTKEQTAHYSTALW